MCSEYWQVKPEMLLGLVPGSYNLFDPFKQSYKHTTDLYRLITIIIPDWVNELRYVCMCVACADAKYLVTILPFTSVNAPPKFNVGAHACYTSPARGNVHNAGIRNRTKKIKTITFTSWHILLSSVYQALYYGAGGG